MSLRLSSLLKLTVAGAAILSVGACKPADKGQGALKSEGIAALNLSKSESGVFSKYFSTEPCDVDEMEALGALAGLGLGESGVNGVSFASREMKGSQVIYRDFAMREDGADEETSAGTSATAFSAKSVVFHCPKMGDESPNFDRVDLTDISIFDQKENVKITAKTLNIASPTAEGARSIVESMTVADASDMNGSGFGAISMTNAKMTSPKLSGSLATLSWGENRNEDGRGKADLTLDSLNLTHLDADGETDMTLAFEGMSARNLYMAAPVDASSALSVDDMMENVMGNLNIFEKPYDELLVETLKIDSEVFNLDFGGIEGITTEKSGLITTRQTLLPTQIQLKPALGEMPQHKRNYDILKSLGFETMSMSASSVTTLNANEDSISVTDGLFVVDDAMRLNFEYQADGLGAMTRKMKALAGTDADPMTAYDELMLKNFRLTMEDNSIVGRGLKLASEMTGQSEKNLKRSLGMAVFAAAMAAENEVQAEVYTETAEAFAEFVKNGGTLTIEANPPAPFPLAPLVTGKGEDVDPATLGFSASQEGGVE